VGFDANGIISALDCKAWCLAGAFMDLAWNDLYGVMTGLDMVSSQNDSNVIHDHCFKILRLENNVMYKHFCKCCIYTFWVGKSTVFDAAAY